MKFGDIVVNGWASERNPHRKGLFVRDKGKTIEFTDGYGDFWETINDKESKFLVIGNTNDSLKLNATEYLSKESVDEIIKTADVIDKKNQELIEQVEELEWGNNERRISEKLWKEAFEREVKEIEELKKLHDEMIKNAEGWKKQYIEQWAENERLKMLYKDCEGVSNQLYKQVRELSDGEQKC